jgi:hypothetical protein
MGSCVGSTKQTLELNPYLEDCRHENPMSVIRLYLELGAWKLHLQPRLTLSKENNENQAPLRTLERAYD